MAAPSAKPPERGRGEPVVPGLWRLRLPLPWPQIPHVNAYAVRAGDGIVLIDCGLDHPGAMTELVRALHQCGQRLETVRHLVLTHAHEDHAGQAAAIVERTGCQLWAHPAYGHLNAVVEDVEPALERARETGRAAGVPPEQLEAWLEHRRGRPTGVSGPLRPTRKLVDGVSIPTDIGELQVVETPGHAPSHVCLHQPEEGILFTGDHVLGHTSLFLEYGFTPDPAGELLRSLDRVDALHARLGLSGHGRPFTDVHEHVLATEQAVTARLDGVRAVLGDGGELTAFRVARSVYGDHFTPATCDWFLVKTLCWLVHLQARGEVRRMPGVTPASGERWRAARIRGGAG